MESKTFRHLHIYREYGEIDEWYIKDFEQKYNICLPKTYKELIMKYNGIKFEEDYIDFINKNGEKDTQSFSFLGFGNKNIITENIEIDNKYIQNLEYYGVPNIIAFARTAEDNAICFDYRDNPKTCEPKVALLVHDEYETDADGTLHMKVEHIANSFDEFLDMLYEYKDDEAY
jgi:hypothetical protein